MKYTLNSETSGFERYMSNLSLVKNLAYLKEEQKYTDEVLLESVGLVFTRGTLAEIAGHPSSGKTSMLLSLLSKLTAAGEICTVVDSADSFDPNTAVLAGVEQVPLSGKESIVRHELLVQNSAHEWIVELRFGRAA